MGLLIRYKKMVGYGIGAGYLYRRVLEPKEEVVILARRQICDRPVG